MGSFETEDTKQRDLEQSYGIPKLQKEEALEMAKDPVCDMDCDEKTAAATSEYKGKTYYFCAPGCKKAFDENPAKYTEGGGQEMAGNSGHQM